MAKRTKRKRTKRRQNGGVDQALLATVVTLLACGLIVLYSATFWIDLKYDENFFGRQLIWIGVSLVAMLVMYLVPYTVWQRTALLMMAANLLLLALVFAIGRPQRGIVRALYRDSVQPGVLGRLVAVIYIATWLTSRGDQLNRFSYGMFPFGIILGVVAGLVVLQPDLSTAALIIATGLAMFFFAGGDPIQIFLVSLIGGSVSGFLIWQADYERHRLVNYVASLRDPAQAGHHLRMAMLAIGEGGLFGSGFGEGRLKFGYLPYPHTDSIFAVVGEEGGLVGCLLVIGLFGLLAYRGYRVALSTSDPFGSLVAFGVTTMIVVEAMLNMLVMVGLVPFTGTALPFFSYGGTQMLVTLSGMGLLLGVSRGRPKGEFDEALDRWWRNGRARLSRLVRRTGLTGYRA
jgi:cell division protein FtsW